MNNANLFRLIFEELKLINKWHMTKVIRTGQQPNLNWYIPHTRKLCNFAGYIIDTSVWALRRVALLVGLLAGVFFLFWFYFPFWCFSLSFFFVWVVTLGRFFLYPFCSSFRYFHSRDGWRTFLRLTLCCQTVNRFLNYLFVDNLNNFFFNLPFFKLKTNLKIFTCKSC